MADNVEKKIILSVETDTGNAGQNIDDLKSKLSDVNNSVIDKPFASLKRQLKDARLELEQIQQTTGSNSEEFRKAAQRVADIKEQFSVLNKTVSAFNPANRLQALVNVTRSASLSIQGLTGGLQFLGFESDNVAKQIARLQGLMAFTDSLNHIDSVKEGFKDVGRVIQSNTVYQKAYSAATATAAQIQKLFTGSVNTTATSFKVLRTAIIATGIGALIVAVGYVITNFSKLKETVLKLIPGLEKISSTISSLITKFKVWTGITTEQEIALKKLGDTADKESKRLQKILDYQGNSMDEYSRRSIESLKKFNDQKKKIYEDESLTEYERTAALTDAQEGYKNDLLKIQKDVDDRIKKEADERKQHYEKQKQENDKRVNDLKQFAEQYNNALKKMFDDRKQLQNEMSLFDKSDREKELINLENDLKQRIEALNESYTEQLASLKEARKKGLISEQKYSVDVKKLNDERLINEELINEISHKKRLEVEKKYSDIILKAIEENTLNEFEKQKKTIEDKYDELLKNAATASQKIALELAKNKELTDLSVKKTTQENVVRSETNVINTVTSNTVQDTDSPDVAREKIAAIEQAKLEARKAAFENEVAFLDQTSVEYINKKVKLEQDLTAISESASNERKQIDQREHDNKMMLYDSLKSSSSALSALIGQQTVAGKALGIATATINTYQGATEVLKTPSVLPEPAATILKVANMATVIASGLKAVKEILKVKVPGGGGGASAPSMSSVQLPPVINSTKTLETQTQDVRVINKDQTPVRAYIVSRDLETNKTKNDFVNDISTF